MLFRFLNVLFFLASISGCYGPKNHIANYEDTFLPHLTKAQSDSVSIQTDKLIRHGDIVSHTTRGEFELNKILTDSENKLTVKNRLDLCVGILQKENLYHLHDRAGIELRGLIFTDSLFESLDNYDPEKVDYVLLRTNHSLNQVLYSGGDFRELDFGNQQKLIQIAGSNRSELRTKKYFIEALYSLTISQKSGQRIYETLNNSNLDEKLKGYNDSLFRAFKKYKPQFERLDAINTWMEMDKNSNSIKELFENTHPIMFLQILSFNPSTVLESKTLSNLKQEALVNIMKNASQNSFYSTYRLAYLTELLVDRNYTVRFLDKLMNEEDKQLFIKQLKNKN